MNTLFENCKDCLHVDLCPRYEKCELLDNENKDTYATDLLNRLKQSIGQAATNIIPLSQCWANLSYDDRFSTYEYYRNMINDCLRELRSGFTTYVYNEDQVRDILRFEPDIKLACHDNIFYITL